MTIRIGNGAGFLGDNLDAPRRLVERSQLDYLTLEYLAELTLSILARVREKNPQAGYAADFLEVLGSLTPALATQPQLKIVTNAGGMSPRCCAVAAARTLVSAGLPDVAIAVVRGDDLFARLHSLQAAGCPFTNLDTGEPVATLRAPIVSANAYLGARPIVEGLAGGARIVITGRVADASLTVGPAVHEFGFAWDDWNRLAALSVAGHLIECGAQATGAFYPHWNEIDLADVGYPIAELEPDGNFTVTKPAGTGGRVNRETISEQLLYEIGDPAHYLTPDVDVDFTTVDIAETGPDRVLVRGATGRPATDTYKVSLAYRAGYAAAGQLLVYGRDCQAKARECARLIFERLKVAGVELERSHVELLGTGQSVPGLQAPPADLREVLLRISVRDSRSAAVERFTRELAPLATAGPAGLAGYTAARGAVRPVYAYWPTLVPKDLVQSVVEIRPASQWADAPFVP
ncbi:MAG TPA: acyclic terpene utilization AtuA family protein [Pirellulales bacterium]|nr:acyclic terpene utilization AtuA family protein [Pirellulales bacterium]